MPLVPGLGFPGGETMIEPWVFMNYKRAAEYLYTAQTLSAEDALRMGLVNRVVARENLEDVTEAVAAKITPRTAVHLDGDQDDAGARLGTDGHASAPPAGRPT